MIVKVEIGMASLTDIAEKACKAYRKELAEVEDMRDVKCVLESLADVVRLWEAVDNFDYEDEFVLTIEKREEQEDGDRYENVESGC